MPITGISQIIENIIYFLFLEYLSQYARSIVKNTPINKYDTTAAPITPVT